MPEIYTRLTYTEVMSRLLGLSEWLSYSDHALARGFRMRIGVQLSALIRMNFVQNGIGGNPDVDLGWPPLSKWTKLARRQGPKTKKKLTDRARYEALDREQKKQVRRLTSQIYDQYIESGMRIGENTRQMAKRRAEEIMNRGGASIPTVEEILLDRPFQILKDTGLLEASLMEGEIVGADGYIPPAIPPVAAGAPDNHVMRVEKGEVVVGTTVPYARKHHEGIDVPQRRLWPAGNEIPDDWMRQIKERAMEVMPDIVNFVLSV